MRLLSVLTALALALGAPAWAGSGSLTAADPESTAEADLADKAGGSCTKPKEVTRLPEDRPADIPSVESPDAPRVRNLGQERSPASIVTKLQLSEAPTSDVRYLHLDVGEFQSADATAVLGPEHLAAQAEIPWEGRRESIRLTLCVDPIVVDASGSRLIEVPPGAYTGRIVVDDPRVDAGAVSYTINVKYEHDLLVYSLSGVATCVAIIAGLAFATGVSPNKESFKKNRGRAVTSLITGFAAAYAVFNAQYISDPAWAGSTAAFIALIVGTAGAAYAATNVSGSVGRSTEDPAKE